MNVEATKENNTDKKATAEIKRKLNQYRVQYGAMGCETCRAEESSAFSECAQQQKALPEDIIDCENDGTRPQYIRAVMAQDALSPEELREYMHYISIDVLKENNDLLHSIKNYLKFFVVLTVLGLIIAVIALLLV